MRVKRGVRVRERLAEQRIRRALGSLYAGRNICTPEEAALFAPLAEREAEQAITSLDTLLAELSRCRAVLTQQEEALAEIARIQPRCIGWFRRREIVFENWPSSGFNTVAPDQWEEIAGWIYTYVCESESVASAALSRGGEQGAQT